ncbi:MAG: hypothetical protein LBC62_03450 [Treponema sp.]|jgi:hypothetical protein|nr:hypothetical protein [Treponema sp.]
MKVLNGVLFFLSFLSLRIEAEPLRVLIAGTHDVSLDSPEGTMVPLSYISSAVIRLEGDTRFFRGIQLDLTAPQSYLAYRGSMASVLYADLNAAPPQGVADIEGRQVSFEALPNKIQNTWQIPIRPSHGLRSSPYVTVPTGVIPPSSFPVLFRLMPVIKGISQEMENMVFQLTVKPILSDEGGVKLNFLYPQQLPGRPVTVLVDDAVVENTGEELLLKEGEHHLVVLSDDYRNQSRRFMVERAKILDLLVELQDPTPLIIFEYPENARIFLDNAPVTNPQAPYPVDPGFHEVRFQISDYSIIRPVTVQKGKTYKVALSVDVNITENE